MTSVSGTVYVTAELLARTLETNVDTTIPLAGSSWPRQPRDGYPSEGSSPTNALGRPIRPLPKRKLKSRLSDEQAERIIYPPIPPSSSPLSFSPQSQSDRGFVNTRYAQESNVLKDEHEHEHEHVCHCGGEHSDEDSALDEDEQAHGPTERYSWPGRMVRYPKQYLDRITNRNKPPPPNSSTSSADGYESFENTNNKKKRKIPNSAIAGLAPVNDLSNVGVPSHPVNMSDEQIENEQQYYGPSVPGAYPVSSGVGISGAGRGRFGRVGARIGAERRPLANAPNSANAFSNHDGAADPGIISTAIANAAEKGTGLPGKGQENISLLERQSSGSNVPKDFTFECKSNSSNKMNMSSHAVSRGTAMLNAPGHINTMRNTSIPELQHTPQPPQQQLPRGPHPALAAALPKKPKSKRPGQSLLAAAQRRRDEKAYENHYNPPKKEDTWICEFCEYESIFGEQPSALVRQYEIKDRKERKRLEEKRRLLEKAKAKGRKNKKGTKGSKQNNNANNQQNMAANQRYDAQYDTAQDGDSQGEEYFEDGYDDRTALPLPLPPPPDPALAVANYDLAADVYPNGGGSPPAPVVTSEHPTQRQ